MTAPGFLVVAKRWGLDPVRVDVSGLRCAWEASRAGTLSCFLAPRDALLLGLGNLKGRWVRYELSDTLRWGGVITATRQGPAGWELACESFHVLLRKRRMARMFRTLTGTPGGLALRALSDADNEDPTGIASTEADEDGPGARLESRAQDLYESVLPDLARVDGHEWDVDADRNFAFVRRLGVDRTASCHLREGRHLVGEYELWEDLWTASNDVLAVPGRRGYAESQGWQEQDPTSIKTYGRLQEALVVPEVGRPAVEALARRRLRQTKDPLKLLTATIADVDRAYSLFGLGDTIRSSLGSAGQVVDWRPLSLGFDRDRGTLEAAGEVVKTVAEIAA